MDVNIWDVGQCIGFESVKMGRQKKIPRGPNFPITFGYFSGNNENLKEKNCFFFWVEGSEEVKEAPSSNNGWGRTPFEA